MSIKYMNLINYLNDSLFQKVVSSFQFHLCLSSMFFPKNKFFFQHLAILFEKKNTISLILLYIDF